NQSAKTDKSVRFSPTPHTMPAERRLEDIASVCHDGYGRHVKNGTGQNCLICAMQPYCVQISLQTALKIPIGYAFRRSTAVSNVFYTVN
ncbi:MAG: hypothetical protein NC350_02800, partial [Corallococcus sp.]|nr:hypothetical protein [Corallococcus sp.]